MVIGTDFQKEGGFVMCDTMVVTSAFTCDGSLLFAKNSDRKPNEPHIIIRIPGKEYGSGKDGLELLIKLVEGYGQGGKAGYTKNLKYHNSYIIADFNTAFVLETAGKHWVHKKVNDICSISNALTIRDKFDGSSNKLIENAMSKGWCKNRKDFDFKDSYENKLVTRLAQGDTRHHGNLHGVAQFRTGSMKSICMQADSSRARLPEVWWSN